MRIIKPKISVVITAYNEERFIGRCLRSIISQSLPSSDYEVIVINDASTDKTAYALELFGDSIRVFNNKKNIGLPASINKGIKVAKGEFLIRLDGDDYVNTNYLNFLHYFLEVNTECDAVACDYFLFDDNENWIKRCDSSKEPIGCGIMFRTKHLLNLGLYDESFRVHEDKDMRLRFEAQYKLGHLNVPLYRYRKHENNITNNQDLMNHHKNKLNIKHGRL
jgi:glycosyltransferase involved in cell wall biosynthesis